MLLTFFALGTLIVVTGAAIESLFGLRTIEWLSGQTVNPSDILPAISIVIAARNEEKNIEAGLSSLLQLDYPRKQIIVVNDRSTDRTGEILERMGKIHPELRIATIIDLPAGWLGKNHAQWIGAQSALGEILLFTDADVVMDKTTLRRAVPFFEKNKLDHLAIAPRAIMPGISLNLFMAGFAVFFNLFARPWRVRNPKSPAHIGIGAFNMVRRSAYEKIGTHQAIAMRPDDDVKLGKLIKRYGFRSEFLLGTDMIFVEWYDSVKALVNGLMKNMFSAVDYRLSVVIGATAVQLAMGVWPFLAVGLTHGPVRLIYLAVILVIVSVCAVSARTQGLSWRYGFGFPIASLAFLYILWKSTLRTLVRGGIEWRGTFYPLKELKSNEL